MRIQTNVTFIKMRYGQRKVLQLCREETEENIKLIHWLVNALKAKENTNTIITIKYIFQVIQNIKKYLKYM